MQAGWVTIAMLVLFCMMCAYTAVVVVQAFSQVQTMGECCVQSNRHTHDPHPNAVCHHNLVLGGICAGLCADSYPDVALAVDGRGERTHTPHTFMHASTIPQSGCEGKTIIWMCMHVLGVLQDYGQLFNLL